MISSENRFPLFRIIQSTMTRQPTEQNKLSI
jgi:hypothetical protein